MIIFEEIFARDSIVLCQIKFLTSQVSKILLFGSSLILFGTQHTRNPWGLSITNSIWWFQISGIWLRFFNPKAKEPYLYSKESDGYTSFGEYQTVLFLGDVWLCDFEGIWRLQFFWGIPNSPISWWRMVYDKRVRRVDSYDCYFLMSTTRLSRRHVSKHLMHPASNSKF